jgi:hypothetical protein
MADRYWVGGTGTWNTTSTTNWSASSGGSSGASVPTAADNVFFDQNSTYTVTLTGALNCLSINVSQGTVTFTSTGTLTVAGSFTLNATAVWSATGTITFTATTSQTITTNGVTLASSININGNGGTFTLGSALTCGTITITRGTFSTSASNYNLTSSISVPSNANTRQLDLNGSTVTCSAFSIAVPTTSFTFNEGTSTVVLTSAGRLEGGGETFYDISSTNFNSFGSDFIFNGLFIGQATFNNGTFTMNNGKTGIIIIGDNNGGRVKFNGTLTTTCTNPWDRVLFNNFAAISTSTIEAAAVNLTNADFYGITATGAATWSGTNLGDGGGNSGITFNSPKTVYYSAATAGEYTSSNWATTSGGSTSSSNYPLIHDTAYFDDNSGTGTFSSANAGVCNFSFGNRTTAITWNPCESAVFNTAWFGNITLSTSVTVTTTGSGVSLKPSGTKTLDLKNINTGLNLYLQCGNIASKGYKLLSDANATTFNMQGGYIDLDTYTFTIVSGSMQHNFMQKAYYFGSGKFVVTGTTGTVWGTFGGLYLIVTGTPEVDITNSTSSAITIFPGSAVTEPNTINFNIIAGTYSLTITGNIRNINFTGFSGTLVNGGRAIFGNLTISSGMTLAAGTGVTTFGSTSGSKTITSNGKTFDFPITFNGVGGTWVLQDNLTVGTTRVVTHANGTVDLNGKTLDSGIRYLTAAGTKDLTFNGGTLLCSQANTTAFNNAAPTGFTTTAGTGTGKISMSAATAKTFVGGGSTYNCTLSNDGAGALTISGNNTFTTLANGVQPTTFTFTSGETTTVTNWNISGTSGNLVTIGSTTTSQHIMSKSSGVVSANYLSVSYSNATGGASWYAGANSTNGGNNSGWLFSNAPVVGNFFLLFN